MGALLYNLDLFCNIFKLSWIRQFMSKPDIRSIEFEIYCIKDRSAVYNYYTNNIKY
jgi:hypothetical protein